MLAYNKETMNNEMLATQAKSLYQMKFIPKKQLQDITSRLTLFNSSGNLLVRIGFFLLGCLLISAIIGFLALFAFPILDNDVENILFVYGIIGVVGAEFVARAGYFNHGLDDAFILSIPLFFCSGFGVTMETLTVVFLMMIVLGFACCVRYAHTLSALIGCIGLVAFVFDMIANQKLIDALFLPFVGLVMALGLYFAAKKLEDNPKCDFYRNAIMAVRGFALLLGYFSVNYMVVRELSQDLMDIVVTPESDIPLAFIFYGLTFLIPVFYIGYAIRTKDRMMLLLGLFTFGYSFFTIRYYHQLMPLEIALILGGSALFALSYFAIRKLKDRKTGVTFEPERGSDSSLVLNAQALVINSQLQTKVMVSEDKMPFGGGGFSGGGSDGGY
ncbi:hypothetical protein [Flavobacterium pedocola]